MDTQEIYLKHGQELYFFALRRVKSKDAANDILQNTFLKIHKSSWQLKDEAKLRPWVFQIVRNEIVNYFDGVLIHENGDKLVSNEVPEEYIDICCFERFIDELPPIYRDVLEKSYIHGKRQEEIAKGLGISIANVKARVRRAKSMMKEKFLACCQYETNSKGQLVGAPNCVSCE